MKATRLRFFFDDHRGHHTITMKRACAEWCNADCPTIYSASPIPDENGWMLNSGGLHIESLPEAWRKMFIKFVVRSSEAFYRKYPHCRSVPNRNGFVENLCSYNHLDLTEVQKIAKVRA